ncbi:hypothetical protein Bhyg_07314, partial [Pseudolycoriella hygida]
MQSFEHVWNSMQFFQTISLTFIAYYIRCLATILNHRCKPILNSLEFIGSESKFADDGQQHLSNLMSCFEAFDEVMELKNEMSNLFGIQLLLNSAFDFIILTISAYDNMEFLGRYLTKKMLQRRFPNDFKNGGLDGGTKIVLKRNARAVSSEELPAPFRKRVLELDMMSFTSNWVGFGMDLIFLKINHMEKTKYVTASDFYPVNRSMLYGMGAAIVTHMLIIFQFQQWEDNQPKLNQLNITSIDRQ